MKSPENVEDERVPADERSEKVVPKAEDGANSLESKMVVQKTDMRTYFKQAMKRNMVKNNAGESLKRSASCLEEDDEELVQQEDEKAEEKIVELKAEETNMELCVQEQEVVVKPSETVNNSPEPKPSARKSSSSLSERKISFEEVDIPVEEILTDNKTAKTNIKASNVPKSRSATLLDKFKVLSEAERAALYPGSNLHLISGYLTLEKSCDAGDSPPPQKGL